MSEIDLHYLQGLGRDLGRPVSTLLALSCMHDPFYADMPSRREAAEWFGNLWQQFGFQPGVHLRRIHYVLISHSNVNNHHGVRYVNTLASGTL